jgi:CheY-like chemotaxis protein
MEPVKKTILCVDDDPDDRLILSEAFSEGYPEVAVVEMENGLRALDYLNVRKSGSAPLPDLIVLDINMPYLDGKETLTRIRQDPQLSDVPVVIFTSSENPNDKALFTGQGVTFLSKPYNVSNMKGIVSYLLSCCS